MVPQAIPGSYSVRYASTNHRDDPHVLVITPGFGDGDASRWPEQGPDMSLLSQDNEKQQQWRRTAAEVVAKDLGLVDVLHQHWILDELPTGYGLFQQVTHPKDSPAAASNGSAKGKLRLDRFVFGHNSKKIRSALSLGKHISNQLFGAQTTCHCDGCKMVQSRTSTSSMADIGAPVRIAPRKRKRTGEYAEIAGLFPSSRAGTGEPENTPEDEVGSNDTSTEREGSVAPGGSPDRRPVRRARRNAAGARNRFAGNSAVEDEHYGASLAGEDGSDYEESPLNHVDIKRVGGRTSSGRRTRPSERLLSGLQQEAQAHAFAALSKPPVPVDEYDEVMASAGKDVVLPSSIVSEAQVAEDLANPSLSREGELVWVRVPLGPPPSTAPETAQLSRWPGIVRSRLISAPSDGAVREEVYRVELLGMSSEDVLDGVRGENVTPWVGYVPSNTEWLDTNPLVDDGLRAGQAKKRWAEIQAEGWIGVANAFRKAHRIAKAYALIQIRPIPTLLTGPHLAIKPGVPPTSLAALEYKEDNARYLSFSHVIFGPELLHLGDYVRLVPDVALAPACAAARTPQEPADSTLPTTLMMRISVLYRGGKGSPLVASGIVFEQIPLDGPPDLSLHDSVQNLPLSVQQTLPSPFPLHQWRVLTPHGAAPAGGDEIETEVLFHQAVAGRYYPMSLPGLEPDAPRDEIVEAINERLEEATNGVGVWQDGQGARGGKGEEGIKALALLLGGMAAGDRTARIEAPNGLAGSRIEQLLVAEEQALGRFTISGASRIGAEAPRPGDQRVTDPADAAATQLSSGPTQLGHAAMNGHAVATPTAP